MFKKARQLLSKAPTGVVKFLLNRYRPHPGAGIKLEYLSKDYYHAHMRLKLKWCNRNYFGTQFGGLLFAIMDAPYALMLTQILGSNYIIWDKRQKLNRFPRVNPGF